MFERGKRYEASVADLAYDGDGVVRLEGKVVFLPMALPGELATFEIVDEKKDFARGRLISFKNAHAGRTKPRCKHFGICGGCQLQHLAYEEQLRVKDRWVREKMRDVSDENTEWLPPLAAAANWHYRERIQVHRSEEGQWGFYRSRSHEVVALEECPVVEPRLFKELQRRGRQIARRVQGMELTLNPAKSQVLRKHAVVERTVDGLVLQTSNESFLQVGEAQNEILVQAAMRMSEAALPKREARVWDLYAGSGNLTLPLAKRFSEVVAFEGDARATDMIEQNARSNGLTSIRVETGDVLAILQGYKETEKAAPSLVVLDPPRSGAKDLMEILPSASKILYVSCDAASLARDARILRERGWQLASIQVLDLFPQTRHVETLALFSPQSR